jgi:hypothetical protein
MKCRGGELWLMVTVRVPWSRMAWGSAATAAALGWTGAVEAEDVAVAAAVVLPVAGFEHPVSTAATSETAATDNKLVLS